MGKAEKLTQSQIDGVQYRRAKLWQIIMVASNGLVGMGFYCLIGLASYSASIGFGIATVAVGGILTFTRIFDAITDPMLAFIYDKVNTRFGKVRILLAAGWVVMVLGVLLMFNWAAGKGHGIIAFILIYMLYIIGYTLYNMTGQTLFPLMTNDPKQRPMVGVWSTIFNYIVPIALNMVYYVTLMPKYGGYNQGFLAAACWITVGVSAVGLILACIGISEYDKPENFVGTMTKKEKLKLKDMLEVLKNNRPLQCYIASAASDKIAQQVASQSIINTMLGGIIIGDMSISTTLSTISIIPSILFAVVGAKYAGKHGNKKTIVTWTYLSIFVSCAMILFFVILHMGGNTRNISTFFPLMAIYVVLTLALNGAKMCVTTGGSAFMADVIDYELDRGGQVYSGGSIRSLQCDRQAGFLHERADCNRRGGADRLYGNHAAAHGRTDGRYFLDDDGSILRHASPGLGRNACCDALLFAGEGRDGGSPETYCRKEGGCAEIL